MRFYDRLGQFEWGLAAFGAGACVFLMMMMTVISISGRYVFGLDLIPGSYNIIERAIFPLTVFWAIPLAHREGSFPRLEVFTLSHSPRLRALITVVVLSVELAIYGVVLWYVTRFALNGIVSGSKMQVGTQLWPLAPVIIMVPLAFLLVITEIARMIAIALSALTPRRSERGAPA